MNPSFEDREQDMELAKQILADPSQTDREILDVAFEAGYDQIKTFNEHFRKQCGMCPGEYRAFHIHFKRVTGSTPAEYRKKQAQKSTSE